MDKREATLERLEEMGALLEGPTVDEQPYTWLEIKSSGNHTSSVEHIIPVYYLRGRWGSRPVTVSIQHKAEPTEHPKWSISLLCPEMPFDAIINKSIIQQTSLEKTPEVEKLLAHDPIREAIEALPWEHVSRLTCFEKGSLTCELSASYFHSLDDDWIERCLQALNSLAETIANEADAIAPKTDRPRGPGVQSADRWIHAQGWSSTYKGIALIVAGALIAFAAFAIARFGIFFAMGRDPSAETVRTGALVEAVIASVGMLLIIIGHVRLVRLNREIVASAQVWVAIVLFSASVGAYWFGLIQMGSLMPMGNELLDHVALIESFWAIPLLLAVLASTDIIRRTSQYIGQEPAPLPMSFVMSIAIALAVLAIYTTVARQLEPPVWLCAAALVLGFISSIIIGRVTGLIKKPSKLDEETTRALQDSQTATPDLLMYMFVAVGFSMLFTISFAIESTFLPVALMAGSYVAMLIATRRGVLPGAVEEGEVSF